MPMRLALAKSYCLNKELVKGKEVMPGPHPSGKALWSLCFPPECWEWGPAPLLSHPLLAGLSQCVWPHVACYPGFP